MSGGVGRRKVSRQHGLLSILLISSGPVQYMASVSFCSLIYVKYSTTFDCLLRDSKIVIFKRRIFISWETIDTQVGDTRFLGRPLFQFLRAGYELLTFVITLWDRRRTVSANRCESTPIVHCLIRNPSSLFAGISI